MYIFSLQSLVVSYKLQITIMNPCIKQLLQLTVTKHVVTFVGWPCVNPGPPPGHTPAVRQKCPDFHFSAGWNRTPSLLFFLEWQGREETWFTWRCAHTSWYHASIVALVSVVTQTLQSHTWKDLTPVCFQEFPDPRCSPAHPHSWPASGKFQVNN